MLCRTPKNSLWAEAAGPAESTLCLYNSYKKPRQELAIVACKREENDSDQFESVDALSADLDLGLVMATVGLGKDHEKENLFPDQGEWHQI